MAKSVWACVILITMIGVFGSCGWAVERELSGVRLGENALDLLDKPDFGQPAFIGPMGVVSVGTEEPTQVSGSTRSAGERSGPAGPSAGGSGGGRSGGRGGARSGGSARVSLGAAAPSEARGMYWYYRRPGGAVIVLTLNLRGHVIALTLLGTAPSPGGETSRGIGLGRGYMEIIAEYGYPDQVVSAGTVLELTYVDHGVRFTLDSMRVREIAIGAHISAAVEAVTEAPEVAPPPPAGLSIEELRSYL